MPQLRFNKGIENVPDCISHKLDTRGFSMVRIINVFCEKGYEIAQETGITVNDKPEKISFALLKHPFHNPATQMIPVDKELPFNNGDITLKIDFNKTFDYKVNIEYHN